MKITKRDLDSELLEESERLDDIVNEYKGSQPRDGYVSYNGEKFYFKKTNDTFLRRIYTEDEIEELYGYLFSKNIPGNVTSSKLSDIRLIRTQHSAAEDGFIEEYNAEPSYILDGDIIKSKVLSNSLMVLTNRGFLYKIYQDHMDRINIMELISKTFNINKYSINSEITDISEIDTDNYLLSLYSYGIYKLCFSKKIIEYLINEKEVRQVIYTKAKSIFIITDKFCGFYTMAGNAIEKSFNMSRSYQIPFKAVQNDAGIFVLGISQASCKLGSSLHGWQIDRTGEGYNNIDGKLPLIDNFNFSTFRSDNEYLYLIGEKNYGKYEIMRISCRTFEVEKALLDELPDDIAAINGKYLFAYNNHIDYVEFNEYKKHIIRQFSISDHSDIMIKVIEDNIYLLSGSEIIKFILPEISNNETELKYVVYNEEDSCNNIDILVAGAGKNEQVTIYNLDTNEVISPSYYMIYNGNTVIKLMNCPATKIYISIEIDLTSKLYGVVCKHNRLFLR